MTEDKTFPRTSAVADVVPAAVRATVQHLVAVSVREPVSDQTRDSATPCSCLRPRTCVRSDTWRRRYHSPHSLPLLRSSPTEAVDSDQLEINNRKNARKSKRLISATFSCHRWLGNQSRRCRVTVLGKLFTSTVPLFTKQQNWQQPS